MVRIIVLLLERNNHDRTSPYHPSLRLIWGVFLIVLLLQLLHRDGIFLLLLRFSTLNVNVRDWRMSVCVG